MQDFENPNFDSKGLSQIDKLQLSKVKSSIVKTEDFTLPNRFAF